MPVDVVVNSVGESFVTMPRRPYGQQSRLDQRLKTVADAEDKAAVNANFLALSLLLSTFTINFALPSGSSPDAKPPQHENMGAADASFIWAIERRMSSPPRLQYAGRHLGSRIAERLGRIVIAVRAGNTAGRPSMPDFAS